jgi:hypothetical protein
MSRKKRSTLFSHVAGAGVQCMVNLGCLAARRVALDTLQPYSAVMATIAALLTIGSTAFRQLPESPLLRQAGASNKKSI